ncbi:MAG: hypothetical protein ATN31_05130 [Candidatus Epulonipiscioides saccharophilum]|nr:MAG: hypothetical protein ATN31_05130 [Epulopiscium sp. AS2M-Bin001]
MHLPSGALQIIKQLENKGFSAYIVGGCVRDIILERNPNDWDITTNALPTDIKKIFQYTYDTGIAHGTVTVILNDQHFEVTTYRVENQYNDYRRPSSVDFVNNIEEDLSRRDFTMNAIAYHPDKGFVDPYNGITDIEHRIIRAVGDPTVRFTEDALRILRAIRFSAQLNFYIDQNTQDALIRTKHLLQFISKERIRDEFNKICLSDFTDSFGFFKYQNVIVKIYDWQILPYISEYINDIFNKLDDEKISDLLQALDKMPTNLISRYSTLLYLAQSGDYTKEALKDLKFDNHTIKNVVIFCKYFFDISQKINTIDRIELKRLLGQCGIQNLNNILKLLEINAHLSNEIYDEQKIVNLKYEIKDILLKAECYTVKDLAITGHDLKELNIATGKEIGVKLNEALEFVFKFPKKNHKFDILNYLVTQ